MCCVNTMRREAEFQRLYSEAVRLGGSANVPPGDAGWDGLGITTYIHLDLSGTKAGDADLERLVHLPAFARVHSISLAGTRVTDAALDLLERQLESETPSDGIGLSHVDLTDTSVTEAKVESLGKTRPWKDFRYGPSKSPKHTQRGS